MVNITCIFDTYITHTILYLVSWYICWKYLVSRILIHFSPGIVYLFTQKDVISPCIIIMILQRYTINQMIKNQVRNYNFFFFNFVFLFHITRENKTIILKFVDDIPTRDLSILDLHAWISLDTYTYRYTSQNMINW